MSSEHVLPTRPKDDKAKSPGAVVEMGANLKSIFLMAAEYRNMNNGSFGTIPRLIQARLRAYQDLAESRPDPFIRYSYGSMLDQSREAVAKVVHAPVNAVVFVSNATTGVNVVLRCLAGIWAGEEGKGEGGFRPQDEVLYFDTIYGGCGRSVDYVVDTSGGRIGAREIPLRYPCEDGDVVQALEKGIQASRKEGKNPRLAIFDVVSSLPGVCVPYPALIQVCKREGLLSLVDGAQGVGMVHIDLSATDPDFFVSNCHKWLHVPRGCAVFYVPERNQHMIPSTLPTSHGYEPLGGGRHNPLPPEKEGKKTKFVKNFEFVGTLDNAPYLCVRDSVAWRTEVLGGEERILSYLHRLAREGGRKAAEMLGTEVLDNEARSLSACAMTNVALPLVVAGADEEWSSSSSSSSPAKMETDSKTLAVFGDLEDAGTAVNWMLCTLIDRYDTFVALYVYRKRLWARISAQVFLDMNDFEETGRVLKEVCEMVGRGEWMTGESGK